MDLNLSNQTQKADQLRPRLAVLRTEMEKRFEVWQRLPIEKQRKWIQIAAEKDPLFDLFVGIVRYAR